MRGRQAGGLRVTVGVVGLDRTRGRLEHVEAPIASCARHRERPAVGTQALSSGESILTPRAEEARRHRQRRDRRRAKRRVRIQFNGPAGESEDPVQWLKAGSRGRSDVSRG